jgi:AmmeMemoRadiSam system protein A
MRSLSEADRAALLRLARSAVVEAVVNERPLARIPTEDVFAERCGVFVTLHIGGRLRGCIGVLEGREPLGEAVVHCASSAARHDPRFPPVRLDELGAIQIELSVLSALSPIQPVEIVIGRHGLAIAAEGKKGVLLPQVAVEHGFEREQFLAETCCKAGLARTAWCDPQTRVLAFTCEVFCENDQLLKGQSVPPPKS